MEQEQTEQAIPVVAFDPKDPSIVDVFVKVVQEPSSIDEQWDASLLEHSDLLEDMVRAAVEEHTQGLTRRVKIAAR